MNHRVQLFSCAFVFSLRLFLFSLVLRLEAVTKQRQRQRQKNLWPGVGGRNYWTIKYERPLTGGGGVTTDDYLTGVVYSVSIG